MQRKLNDRQLTESDLAGFRLELNYAMQEEAAMVPMMMQQGYKAKCAATTRPPVPSPLRFPAPARRARCMPLAMCLRHLC